MYLSKLLSRLRHAQNFVTIEVNSMVHLLGWDDAHNQCLAISTTGEIGILGTMAKRILVSISLTILMHLEGTK